MYELDHGMDASVMWREAAMLRDAVHDHIVPLYGVAVKVGCCGSWQLPRSMRPWKSQAR